MEPDGYRRRPRPSAGRVDVWLTRISEMAADAAASYVGLLTAEEAARYSRYLVADPKIQFLVARALLRTTLSRYADVPLASWEFETNDYGRPYVVEPAHCRDLRFNLSHTRGLVACAVTTDGDIGVDVEDISRTVDIGLLSPRVFSEQEQADLLHLGPERRKHRFFSYWTLKESYIKARGMGLSLPLDGFWFDLEGRHPRIRFNEKCPDDPSRWRFREVVPTPDHKLAVAMSSAAADLNVVVRWAVPAVSSTDRSDDPIASARARTEMPAPAGVGTVQPRGRR